MLKSNVAMNYSLCCLLLECEMNFKTLLRMEHNTEIECWYELFNCCVLLDHVMNYTYFLQIEDNLSMQPWSELFICRVLVHHVIKCILSIELRKIVEFHLCLNCSFVLCTPIIQSPRSVSTLLCTVFEYNLNMNSSFVKSSGIP